ncbi:hypothetical protein [Chryseobacterium terrae]|uniref:Uncharacterized protein n=1 Tax=Chryseobacterium terrae TaxID=3163299 RepID=A0ABW8XXM5_9FLAO
MNLEELNKGTIIEFLKTQQAKRKFVITPSSILKNLGFPIVEHHFIIQYKSTRLELKQILVELHKEEFLIKRKSPQDFLGIKEVGYDFVFENIESNLNDENSILFQ